MQFVNLLRGVDLVSEIKKYSEISRSHSLIIDNFNSFTNCNVVCERIDFIPVYRVFKRDVFNPSRLHEKYFLSSSAAFSYWSDLMAEKLDIF